MSILFLAIILITLMILSYNRVPLVVSVILLFIITVVLTRLRLIYPTPTGFRWAFGIITVTLMGFSIKPLRRLLISDRLFGWYRKVMPSMSRTEREALEAGTVWWEGEIFSGRPRWRRLLRLGAPTLTEKEQAFLDGPVEELCRMLDDWEICEHHRRVPDPVWAYLREHRFFSMIIPVRLVPQGDAVHVTHRTRGAGSRHGLVGGRNFQWPATLAAAVAPRGSDAHRKRAGVSGRPGGRTLPHAG